MRTASEFYFSTCVIGPIEPSYEPDAGRTQALRVNSEVFVAQAFVNVSLEAKAATPSTHAQQQREERITRYNRGGFASLSISALSSLERCLEHIVLQ